jgi:hypothetical protein
MIEMKTSVDREIIKIDGKEYELISPSEFSFKEYAWLSDQGKRICALASGDEFTQENYSKVKKAIDKTLDKVLLAPFWIKRKLNYNQKITVISFFLKEMKQGKIGTIESSQDSSDSTEGRRRTG